MRYKLKFKKQAQEVKPVQPSVMDAIKNILTSDLTKRTIGMGLGGAAIGGGLLGSASRGTRAGETEEERRKRLRNAIVVGSMLGGVGGSALSLAGPTLLGPDPHVKPQTAIGEKLLDRHVTLPVGGAAVGLGAEMAIKQPTARNLSAYLQDPSMAPLGGLTQSKKTGKWYPTGGIDSPSREFVRIQKGNKMLRIPRRLLLSLKIGGPGFRARGPLIGTAAGAVLNWLIDRGLVGTGEAITNH